MILVVAIALYVSFCISGMWGLHWITKHRLTTWGDMLSFAGRRRACESALLRGAVPCSCHYGRRLLPPRFQTKWSKSESCGTCGGTGAILPEPERTVLR